MQAPTIVKPPTLLVVELQNANAADMVSPLSGSQRNPDFTIIEGELWTCQFGHSPAGSGSKPSETWTKRYFVLKGCQLLISEEKNSRQEVFCILNSGYLIRGQVAGIISIFNPGKSKISLKASNDEECQKWVTCLRKASVGYRTEEAMVERFSMPRVAEEAPVEDDDDEDDEDDDYDDKPEPQTSPGFSGKWTGPQLTDGVRNGEGRYQLGNLVFDGQWKNDMLNGHAVMADLETGMRYSGAWRHNCQHGRGELEFGNGDRYVGDFFNGRILGSGILTQKSSGGAGSNQYRGQFCDGTIAGFGSMFWEGGDHYEGYFQNGVAHGPGRLTYSDIGEIHIGTWTAGWLSGQCEIQFVQSGTRFEGDFGDHGGAGRSGVLQYRSGGRYEGQVSGERRHGQGTMTWIDGSVFAGSWVNDEMSGDGILTNPQTMVTYSGGFQRSLRSGFGELNFGRRKYIGNWDNDTACGNGVMIYQNGNVYDGDWAQGRRTGFGKFLYSNSKVAIEGQWIDGKISGKALCRFSDGSSFECEFRDFLRNGRAVISFANGEMVSRDYVDDKLIEVSPTAVCKSPNSKKEQVASSPKERRIWKERFTFRPGATSSSTYVERFQILSIDEEDCPFLLAE